MAKIPSNFNSMKFGKKIKEQKLAAEKRAAEAKDVAPVGDAGTFHEGQRVTYKGRPGKIESLRPNSEYNVKLDGAVTSITLSGREIEKAKASDEELTSVTIPGHKGSVPNKEFKIPPPPDKKAKDASPLSTAEIKELQALNDKGAGRTPAETARVKELSRRYLDAGQYNSNKAKDAATFKPGDRVWANPIGKSGGTVKGVVARINASGQVVIEAGGREHAFHPANVRAYDVSPVADTHRGLGYSDGDKCPQCAGVGERTAGNKCAKCGGTGKVRAKDETYRVTDSGAELLRPDVEPVGDIAPHKFEKMPGNKPNTPCNRCLERKNHPNHK